MVGGRRPIYRKRTQRSFSTHLKLEAGAESPGTLVEDAMNAKTSGVEADRPIGLQPQTSATTSTVSLHIVSEMEIELGWESRRQPFIPVASPAQNPGGENAEPVSTSTRSTCKESAHKERN